MSARLGGPWLFPGLWELEELGGQLGCFKPRETASGTWGWW